MIKTNNLSYQYKGSEPIQFPDIHVEPTEPLLICGESGCGKSTLLHLLAGLRKPKQGEVKIDGVVSSQLSASKIDQFRGNNIGIVYQQSYFIESLSVLDNLQLSPYAGNKSKTLAIADRLSIQSLLNRNPRHLSVGQQQRANIARAVMNSPKLILADEPTSALDNKNCYDVLELLIEEARACGSALIIVTHDDRLKNKITNQIELQPILN